ncbi:glutathione synthase [Pseudoalteromonas aurantia]|uniref:Glutathione synthetase n=1 Tax=Pseudoalteromonas aurantia TaxID=43654 RepID=A0A5S3VD57_9GAMM|nr:glutathione synthase [Pseudoalteromonas aurantia]TMO58540.1 glutathione synthase [Pseudoalteromonas aurantia]TMO70122.1 glutathione synthase [Pseudoalteromonas aurantia]TMO73125.1 glutathione synthase [Pseudoalteromonas aurantia]
MAKKLGIISDPISGFNIKKDTGFAMMMAAQARGYELYYMEMDDLYLYQGNAMATAAKAQVFDDETNWYQLEEKHSVALSELDVILMRKDPPFDTEYIYATYMLEQAEQTGTLIINKPQSLRDANEKLFTAWFSEHTPDTLVTRSQAQIRRFLDKHQDIILKPLDGMGGASIFRVKHDDPNIGVICETLTEHGSRFAMAQQFIPEIKQGDKRVLVVDGEVIPYCLARIPQGGETRGNLAAGGRGEARPISDDDRKIAEAVAPTLKAKGLVFVGLDIIGNKLTEINVTAPTCVKEIEAAYDISIMDKLFDAIARKLNHTQ